MNPILSQSGGWLIVNGTQRTDSNRLLKMIEDNKNSPIWYVDWLTMADLKEYCWVSKPDQYGKLEFNINPHLIGTKHYLRGTPIENVQDVVDSEPHRKSWYMREYLNIPTSLEENSYYDECLQLVESKGNIDDEVAYHNPTKFTYTAWDIGINDSTAITFFQLDEDKDPIVIDYYEDSGHGVGHYIDAIKAKPYKYGNHFVPVDSGQRTFQLGIDLIQFCKQTLDFTMTRLHKTKSIRADIELVRDAIPRCKFNLTHTEDLLKCLYGYHEDVATGKPKHNSVSHGADSFRYMCVAVQANLVVPILHYRYHENLPTEVYSNYGKVDSWQDSFNNAGLPTFTS